MLEQPPLLLEHENPNLLRFGDDWISTEVFMIFVPSLLWQIFVGSFFAAQRLDAQGPGRL
jgi:hypothetical protein